MNNFKMLSAEETIEKLNAFTQKAEKAIKSDDFVIKLGGLTIFSGIADFMAIQAARLFEQIILKTELAENKTPSFYPRDDLFFYDNQINTRNIIKGIQKHMPFKAANQSSFEGDINLINKLASKYLTDTIEFLNRRNAVIHHIGNPKKNIKDILNLIDKTIACYKNMESSQREFFKVIYPYRFGEKELKYFKKIKSNII